MLEHPSMEARCQAEGLLFWTSQDSAREAWHEGKLDSLSPLDKDGLLVTPELYPRIKMLEIVGRRFLPILLPQERLAALYCEAAHKDGHFRDPADVHAGTRKSVWIEWGRKLAKKIYRSCMRCR